MVEIKLKVFEGPLDLLLHLIQQNEMDIYDIPICEITEQYLQYLDLMKMLDLDVASEFLVMAATLLQIKSESMLPRPKTPESGLTMDAREELVRQLVEYKRFKEAARAFQELERRRSELYPRAAPAMEPTREVVIQASLFDLLALFKNALEPTVWEEEATEIQDDPVTVMEKIHTILDWLKERGQVDFEELLSVLQTKMEVIATFLAALELAKVHAILISQRARFEKIVLQRGPNFEEAISGVEIQTSY